MNLLLDSHALIWALSAPEKLTSRARNAICDPENAVFYSVASVWEIELKVSKGKLALPPDWISATATAGFTELAIESAHAVASTRLPWHHQDPFDRMLVAQSLTHGFALVTRDSILGAYGARILAA